MEEKRYPELNEEQGMDMCCEPAAEAVGNAPTSVNGVTKVHDWIDDLDWLPQRSLLNSFMRSSHG